MPNTGHGESRITCPSFVRTLNARNRSEITAERVSGVGRQTVANCCQRVPRDGSDKLVCAAHKSHTIADKSLTVVHLAGAGGSGRPGRTVAPPDAPAHAVARLVGASVQ